MTTSNRAVTITLQPGQLQNLINLAQAGVADTVRTFHDVQECNILIAILAGAAQKVNNPPEPEEEEEDVTPEDQDSAT